MATDRLLLLGPGGVGVEKIKKQIFGGKAYTTFFELFSRNEKGLEFSTLEGKQCSQEHLYYKCF